MRSSFFLLPLLLLVIESCSKIELAGVSAVKYLNLDGRYSSIVVSGPMQVETSESYDMVEVTSDANVLPYVQVHVMDNTLFIEYEDGIRLPSRGFVTEVRLPYVKGVASVRISDAAEYTSSVRVVSSFPLMIEAESASDIRFDGLSASNLILNMSDASTFVCGSVFVEEASVNLSDASTAEMDGVIWTCSANLEDASELAGMTRIYLGEYTLDIHQLYVNMSDASSASFHSDGTMSGTLRDGSCIRYTGSAASGLKLFDGSRVICESD